MEAITAEMVVKENMKAGTELRGKLTIKRALTLEVMVEMILIRWSPSIYHHILGRRNQELSRLITGWVKQQ